MAARARLRWLVPLGVLLTAAATLALLFAGQLALFQRFEVDGVRINPRAAVRDDVTYQLTVWEEAFVAPWAEQSQLAFLQRVLEEFSEGRPNVNVEIVLLDEAEARTQLAAAIAAGHPPDVYGAVRGVLAGMPGQVPASPYLSVIHGQRGRSEPPPFATAAVAGLSAEQTMWGWPRGLWWDAWLIRSAALARHGFDTTALGTDGWDYEAVLRAASATADRLTVALDVTSLHVLEQLLGAAGAAGAASDTNDSVDEELLAEAASFVRRLVDEAAVGTDTETMSRSRLAQLYEGRADVIGPVNPYTAQSAQRRVEQQLTLAPVPRPPGRAPAFPVSVSAYFVFHQGPDAYRGDDHTRLAAELAAFLAAKSEEWLVEWIGLLPVSTAGWEVWNERSPWNTDSRIVLEEAFAYATAAPPGTQGPVPVSVQTQLQPVWRAFIVGDMTPEQFAREALQIIRNGQHTSR